MATIIPPDLSTYKGKNISAICGNGYNKPGDNHCAHFVSHMMGYTFGYTCRDAGNGKVTGANVRVHELFARCPSVGAWDDRPSELATCLVFVTAESHVNLATKTMMNVPKKHIGICLGSTIWHYSNANHKVVTQTPEQFIHHYPGSDIALFYGALIP